MGSTSIVVIGENIDEQLAPFKVTDDLFRPQELYFLGWSIGPGTSEWQYAMKLRKGRTAPPQHSRGDEPPGLAYSAYKRDIDLPGMREETRREAGAIWEEARRIGVPDEAGPHTRPGQPLQGRDFLEKMSLFMEERYSADSLAYAWHNFLDIQRLSYPQDRYVELRFKDRLAEPYVLLNHALISSESFSASLNSKDPMRQWDNWLDFTAELVEAQTQDTLISKVYLRQ